MEKTSAALTLSRGLWVCAAMAALPAFAAEPAVDVAEKAGPTETFDVLKRLQAAGDAFVQELQRTYDQLILGVPVSAELAAGAATSYKGWSDELGCELDARAFRAPFFDSVVTQPFDVETVAPALEGWLVQPDTGRRVALELQPSDGGSVAVAPALRPGLWALVVQGSAGDARCIPLQVDRPSPPEAACVPGRTGTRGCEVLALVQQGRYADLRTLSARLPTDDVETRLLIAAAACARGHEPRDLLPGDGRSCEGVRAALRR